MTVITRRRAKRTRKPVGYGKRNAKTATVRVIYPNRTPAAIQRGRQLAAQVREELAALANGSLNETMSQLRGREWS
jgi:hypothetical protein